MASLLGGEVTGYPSRNSDCSCAFLQLNILLNSRDTVEDKMVNK